MTAIDTTQYTFEDLWQEREWRKCFPQTTDPEALMDGWVHFVTNYWHIRHPERGRILFEPFEAQLETIKSFIRHRYTIILKARQIGFSTLVACYAFWLAQYPDRPILMLSRTEREAIKLLQKSKYGRQFLPEWMKFRMGPYNETQTRVELSNNSFIESLPSASDPARGESAYLVIVDEFAFLPNDEEAWGAIEPVADVGGRVILLSTAKGEGNIFHELFTGARAGNNRFKDSVLFFPWSAQSERGQDWYDAKKSDTQEHIMAQEYPDNEEDAFLKSGRPVFDLSMLREFEARPPIAKGHLDERLKFHDDGGSLSIWAWPEEDARYCIGADVSQGLEHGDYSSVHVINARTHEVVASWHGHIDPDLLGTDVLPRMGWFYNQALIGVESNTMGLVTLKYLQKQAKYFPIYYERSPKYKRSVPTDVLGFATNQVTKPLVIGHLAEALRSSMKLHEAETLAELRTFVRDDKGKMGGSPYDDRTMSLAIANYMMRFVFFSEFQPEEEIKPGSFADWERRLYGNSLRDLTGDARMKRKPPRKPIGTFAVRSQ